MTASHRELPLDALERLSVDAALVGRQVAHACRWVEGVVVIATCNRFELYVDTDSSLPDDAIGHAVAHTAEVVGKASGVDPAEALASFTVRTGTDAVEHLFAVASGLDSMVVGEREIAGQVKRALATARDAHVTSKTLELLFQTASRTSKRVATDTELGAAGRSIVALGLELAGEHLPPWRGVRTVLIGTGSYAGASVAALRSLGCHDIRVYSRSGRARQFAADRGVGCVDDLIDALQDADLVVSCSGQRSAGAGGRVTSSPKNVSRGNGAEQIARVLDAASVVRARSRAAERADIDADQLPKPEAERPLVIMDLALHRDVDPRVADVEGVLLYDLTRIAAHSPELGSKMVEPAWQIVHDAVEAFESTRLGRVADSQIVALLDEAEERIRVLVAERVAALGSHNPAGGTGGEKPDVEAITREIRRRVHAELHPKIVAIRKAATAAAAVR